MSTKIICYLNDSWLGGLPYLGRALQVLHRRNCPHMKHLPPLPIRCECFYCGCTQPMTKWAWMRSTYAECSTCKHH